MAGGKAIRYGLGIHTTPASLRQLEKKAAISSRFVVRVYRVSANSLAGFCTESQFAKAFLVIGQADVPHEMADITAVSSGSYEADLEE
jgi:hypothetical protein